MIKLCRRLLAVGAAAALAAVGMVAVAASAQALASECGDALSGNAVQNCGFETGDFTSWTSTGAHDAVTSSADWVHSGTSGASLQNAGSVASLSQTVEGTLPGRSYTFSYWMDNPVAGTPNSWAVQVTNVEGGPFTFDSMTNVGALPWAQFTHGFTALGDGTPPTITFEFRNDIGQFGLDDIVVVQPASECDAVDNNLVRNCGFETGDFTDWSDTGGRLDGVFGSNFDHSGSYGAYLGTIAPATSTLSQTVTGTSPSTTYTFSYWVQNYGAAPNSFAAVVTNVVGGPLTFNAITDVDAFPWIQYTDTFTTLPDGTPPTISFVAGQSSAGLFMLDDVVVTKGVPPTANPVFTSTDHVTLTADAPASFTVTTQVDDAHGTATLTCSGCALPTGISFADNGDGTAALSGVPFAAAVGTYSLDIVATNSHGSTWQVFTLTVNPSTQPRNPVHFVNGGTGSPKALLGGYYMQPFGYDDSRPQLSFVSNVQSPAGTLGFSPPLQLWPADELNGNWGNGYHGETYVAGPTSGVIMTLPPRTAAFYFYALGDLSGTWNITATTDNGTTSGPIAVNSGAGTSNGSHANYFGFYTDDGSAIRAIEVSAEIGAFQVGVGEFGIATTPQTKNPVFTSASDATFAANTSNTFSVQTKVDAAHGTAVLSCSGCNLPNGVTFTDNGNGSATLAGTPTAGGVYTFPITATNGHGSTTQQFTLTVNAPSQTTPTITWPTPTSITYGTPLSAAQLDATANVPGTFTYTPPAGTVLSAGNQTLHVHFVPTDGTDYTDADASATLVVNKAAPSINWPTPAPITSGTALSSTQLDATADVRGTFTYSPSAGTVLTPGVHTLSVHFTPSDTTDYNNASTTVQIIVDQPPAITSTDHVSFKVGTFGSFTITTTGYPSGTRMHISSSALPAGLSLADNNDGTATLSGTPDAGTGGVHQVTITADNGVAPAATQTLTITISEAPHFTAGPTAITATVGDSVDATYTAAGYPTPTVTLTGTLPAGLSFASDSGTGSATITGIPAAGSGGVYHVSVSASNGIDPSASLDVTITVYEPPTITSADHATFIALQNNSFQVTTTGGYPTGPITFSTTGPLPPGVTLSSGGVLSGNPPVSASGYWQFTITASNGPTSTDQVFTLFVHAPAVAAGSMADPGGLNVTTLNAYNGECVTWALTGYAPYAPVTVIAYPRLTHAVPYDLGTYDTNANGKITVNVCLPNSARGSYTVLAAGYALNSTIHYQEARTIVQPLG